MKDQDEYSKAFNGEDLAATDDAAEGATEAPAVAVVMDAEQAVEDAAADLGEAEAPAEDPGQMDMLAEGGADMPAEAAPAADVEADSMAADEQISPEDVQRQKSWEGRLRKREEELAAREAALQTPAEPVVDDAEIAEIKQRLADDFGDELVDMIGKLVSYEARKLAEQGVTEKIGGVSAMIDQVINDTKQAFQNMHYSAIADAHEDFMEIAESPKFTEWLGQMPEELRQKAEMTVQSGSAGQIIKLLNEYKAYCKAKDDGAMDDTELALDAASGVRSSSPVKLPGRAPANPDDEYKAAWSQM